MPASAGLGNMAVHSCPTIYGPLEEAGIANGDAVKISRCCSVIGKGRGSHHGSPIPGLDL